MDYKNCSIVSTNTKIVVTENKSRFEIINKLKHPVTKIQVDGCLIPNNEQKCDWILSIEHPEKRVMYVELKGCDLDKAILQLSSTLSKTNSKFHNYKKECYAVTTRVPKHGSTVRKRCIDFFRNNGATLSVKNIVSSIYL